MEYKLRLVANEDTPGVKKLAEELGYPSSEEKISEIIEKAIKHEDHRMIVVEDIGQLLGYIHLVSVGLESYVEIAALSVLEEFRKHGIGKALIAESKKIANEKGADFIRIRSNIIRPEAYKFFEQQGFKNLKTQEVFVKEIFK